MSGVPSLNKKSALKILVPALLVAAGAIYQLAPFNLNIPTCFELWRVRAVSPRFFEFGIYDRLLLRHVKNGLVDYRSLREDPDLPACCDELKRTSPDGLKGKLEKLSFWINTYNLLTIKLICDCYPVKSLKQEPALRSFIVGGRLYSLKQIKEEVLPPLISSSDWRAIFLICNGSLGAPVIAGHAYSASKLSDELQPALTRFVLSEANYSFDHRQKVFSISPFYRMNLRFIDEIYPSPFFMVNASLPEGKRIDLDKAVCNYAMPYDWRINDLAWIRESLPEAGTTGNRNYPE